MQTIEIAYLTVIKEISQMKLTKVNCEIFNLIAKRHGLKANRAKNFKDILLHMEEATKES
jgi:hypothetical protein